MEHETEFHQVTEKPQSIWEREFLFEKATLAVFGTTALSAAEGTELIPNSDRIGEIGFWILCAVVIFVLLQVAHGLIQNDQMIDEAELRGKELDERLAHMRASLDKIAKSD